MHEASPVLFSYGFCVILAPGYLLLASAGTPALVAVSFLINCFCLILAPGFLLLASAGTSASDGMLFNWFRDRRRAKLWQTPWPSAWLQVLDRNVMHYSLLPSAQQKQLRDIAGILITEKFWEGCNGFVITDEVKVTISAQAALLVLGIEHDYYDRVPTVLVYPSTFWTAKPDEHADNAFVPDQAVLGQAVYRGPVILAWDEVVKEGRVPESGHNVVIHEFAHQLDFLDDVVDGVPPLASVKAKEQWLLVMNQALELHRQTLEHRGHVFFSVQAAESLTEFFADSSEAFFCKPMDLAAEFPDVFAQLAGYYRINPRDWFVSHR